MAASVCALPWPGFGSQGCRCGCRTGAALKHQPRGCSTVSVMSISLLPGWFCFSSLLQKAPALAERKTCEAEVSQLNWEESAGEIPWNWSDLYHEVTNPELFRKGVSGIFWVLAEMQGAHDTQSYEFVLPFFFLFKQNWSFSEMFQSFVLCPLSGVGYMREEGC